MNLSEARLHFIGIGGIGMSGIAELLANRGCRVTGSDLSDNAQVERLKAQGVEIKQGHKSSNIPEHCDAVVYSSAVKASNPEIKEAKRRHIPIIQRAEMLSELMRLKRGIAIGGTHGKTTTTSMVATLLISAKLDPTVVVGGRLDLIKSTAALGKGDWFVAEADESDGSFLKLSPEITVVTNIDNDHLDHYRNFDHLFETYKTFAEKIPFYGVSILCVDDPWVSKLSKTFPKRQMTYGLKPGARLHAVNIRGRLSKQVFEVELDKKKLGELSLSVPGRHNILNSLAAVAVGMELGLDFATIAEGVGEYRGVDRRLQVRGQFNGAIVVDDYGHHPTEIKASIEAMKQAYPDKKLNVLFQPHRFTRTKTCWTQFLTCFKGAHQVGIVDIYGAGEKPLTGISSEKLVKAVSKKQKNVFYWKNLIIAQKNLQSHLGEGELLLTLGAGDVWKVGSELVKNDS